jgi:protein involved in ribonucleotide reduction
MAQAAAEIAGGNTIFMGTFLWAARPTAAKTLAPYYIDFDPPSSRMALRKSRPVREAAR